MDVRFINPFIAAVKSVFSTMLSTEIVVSKPVLKGVDEQGADVSAVIGLSGDAIGSVVLSFPMSTAVKAASKFAGIQMSAHHEDFSDALGELANMVAGHAKSRFEGLDVSISLPSVIIGQEHTVSQSRHAPRLALPCDSALGRFCVEVAILVQKRNTPRPAGSVAERRATCVGDNI
jgi:chemotaxis protein CheX